MYNLVNFWLLICLLSSIPNKCIYFTERDETLSEQLEALEKSSSTDKPSGYVFLYFIFIFV